MSLKALLILVLASANLVAFQISTTRNGSYIKWPTGKATYQVNTTGGPTGAKDAIQSALQTWNLVPGSLFRFTNAGATATSTVAKDGANIICFKALSGDGLLAKNSCWYDQEGTLFESDIAINTNCAWSTTGDTNSYDLQEVVTHELGHSLSLVDLYEPTESYKAMYGYSGKGETWRRELSKDDRYGILAIYTPGSRISLGMEFTNGQHRVIATKASVGTMDVIVHLDLSAVRSNIDFTCPDTITIPAGKTSSSVPIDILAISPFPFRATIADIEGGFEMTTEYVGGYLTPIGYQLSVTESQVSEDGGTLSVWANSPTVASSDVEIPLIITSSYGTTNAAIRISQGYHSGGWEKHFTKDGIYGENIAWEIQALPGNGYELGRASRVSVLVLEGDPKPTLEVRPSATRIGSEPVPCQLTLSGLSRLATTAIFQGNDPDLLIVPGGVHIPAGNTNSAHVLMMLNTRLRAEDQEVALSLVEVLNATAGPQEAKVILTANAKHNRILTNARNGQATLQAARSIPNTEVILQTSINLVDWVGVSANQGPEEAITFQITPSRIQFFRTLER